MNTDEMDIVDVKEMQNEKMSELRERIDAVKQKLITEDTKSAVIETYRVVCSEADAMSMQSENDAREHEIEADDARKKAEKYNLDKERNAYYWEAYNLRIAVAKLQESMNWKDFILEMVIALNKKISKTKITIEEQPEIKAKIDEMEAKIAELSQAQESIEPPPEPEPISVDVPVVPVPVELLKEEPVSNISTDEEITIPEDKIKNFSQKEPPQKKSNMVICPGCGEKRKLQGLYLHCRQKHPNLDYQKIRERLEYVNNSTTK